MSGFKESASTMTLYIKMNRHLRMMLQHGLFHLHIIVIVEKVVVEAEVVVKTNEKVVAEAEVVIRMNAEVVPYSTAQDTPLRVSPYQKIRIPY